jgi:hypothetical protein
MSLQFSPCHHNLITNLNNACIKSYLHYEWIQAKAQASEFNYQEQTIFRGSRKLFFFGSVFPVTLLIGCLSIGSY